LVDNNPIKEIIMRGDAMFLGIVAKEQIDR
jgi:hypothetical protein